MLKLHFICGKVQYINYPKFLYCIKIIHRLTQHEDILKLNNDLICSVEGKGVKKSREETQNEKKKELEKRLQDMKGVLPSPAKKGNKKGTF